MNSIEMEQQRNTARSINAQITFSDPEAAFYAAIEMGRLSDNPASSHYAGDYMYMGHIAGRAQFKHILTREYLSNERKAA